MAGEWNQAAFQREHGICEEAWVARAYARYRSGAAGVEDLIRIDPGYATVPRQAVRWRTQTSGLAIPRRALPGTSGPRPLAELRPDAPLTTDRRSHYHPGGDLPHDHGASWPFVPNLSGPLHIHSTTAKYLFVKRQLTEFIFLWPRISASGFWQQYFPALEAAKKMTDQLGFDISQPTPRNELEQRLGLSLPSRPPGRRAPGRGSPRVIGEIDLAGQRLEVHSEFHVRGESETKRVDINPLALQRLNTASRLYFVLEGCIKADAVLSSILDSRRPESVVSVPSVTLWTETHHAARGDLATLADLMRDREVVVVVDSDWNDYGRNRGSVFSQACRVVDQFRQLGLSRVAVAAPSAEPEPCVLHGCVEGSKRGVDDFLADGMALDDLTVLEERSSWALIEELRRGHKPGPVGFETVARVAHELVLRARPDTGVASASHRALGEALSELQSGSDSSGDEQAAARRRRALERRARRACEALRRDGLAVASDNRRSRLRLPLHLVPPPGTLGTIRSVGIPSLRGLDLDLRRRCEECGEPLPPGIRASARLHKPCATRRRVRAYRSRRGNAQSS